jgi:signal transduction histidine kinase
MDRETMFAPAERVSQDEAAMVYDRLASAEYIHEVLDALPDPVALLNATRQVVFANEALLTTVGADEVENVVGQRPGEALGCISVHDGEWECGTSERCRYCGAVHAILESHAGIKAVDECRLSLVKGGQEAQLDLLVTAVPFEVEDATYTLLMLQDISDEKRRRSLEQIFFHDIINTAGSLGALVNILNRAPDAIDLEDELRNAEVICDSLLEDIAAQRDLAAAEAGDLAVIPARIDCARLMNELKRTIEHHKVAQGRTVELDESGDDVVFECDKRLVRRIVTNMLKNALEATPEGTTVKVGYALAGDKVRFTVHNPGFIPRNVQMQLFQRSFTTKGSGRGLGTYSMKLLATQYLGGSIWFDTSEESGTTFTLELPLAPAA